MYCSCFEASVSDLESYPTRTLDINTRALKDEPIHPERRSRASLSNLRQLVLFALHAMPVQPVSFACQLLGIDYEGIPANS